ncbi:MAG TPA: 4a-hydroxytetrahydrobiopterin dehydratase [Candidatus Baltobacteraceae bacterium]|nr:4a-hydroxytetrahydrobiopterin dehydratase [Candidatus Baltobacteraceae bacterium]
MDKNDRCFDQKRLAAAEIKKSLPSGWKARGKLIETGRLDFATFPTAIIFVDRLAKIAERENHHPEISVSWKRITLQLTTHDAGGVTEMDIRMARLINALLKQFSGRVRYPNK